MRNTLWLLRSSTPNLLTWMHSVPQWLEHGIPEERSKPLLCIRIQWLSFLIIKRTSRESSTFRGHSETHRSIYTYGQQTKLCPKLICQKSIFGFMSIIFQWSSSTFKQQTSSAINLGSCWKLILDHPVINGKKNHFVYKFNLIFQDLFLTTHTSLEQTQLSWSR